MRLGTIFGLLTGNLVFFASVILALGGLESFLDFKSALIVLGGTFSAMMICVPFKKIKKVLKETKEKLIKAKKRDYGSLIEEIISLAQARRKGDTAFDRAVPQVKDKFLKDAASVLFWTDAEVSADEFRDLLETRCQTYLSESSSNAKFYKTASKFPPAFGMMGTVLGLIALLASLGDPDAKSQIGPAMAVALVTTLYGIAISNILITPIAEGFQLENSEDKKAYDMVIEGIMLIQQNKPVRYIEEKLKSFLLPDQRPAQGAAQLKKAA